MNANANANVSDLCEHPKNQYYFDDIKGDGWDDFLKSVRTSGVTNAITVDQNNTIISGHQRVRAAKLLGIDEVPVHYITYTEEELAGEYPKDIKDLIESNLKQRVAGNANPIKLGRCIQFLEGYYGIQQGKRTDLVTFPNNSEKSQPDLAEELGISVDTLRNYKMLADMIPEIQDLVDTGIVTKTTALSIVKQLDEDEQRQLAEMLPKNEKVSSREIEFYKERVKQLSEENEKLKKTEKIEVVPEDYEDLKQQLAAKNEELAVAREETAKAQMSLRHQKEVEASVHSNIIGSISRLDSLLKTDVAKILEYGELANCSDVVKNKVEKLSNLMISLATQLTRALGTQDVVDVEVIDVDIV